MRVLVTGATGTLGSALMSAFANAGHEPVAMSRKAGPGRVVADVATGEGLLSAVADVDAIVHAASEPRKDPASTDVTRTRQLADFGIPLLYVSIVGVDANPYKYYRVKRDGERVLEASGGPVSRHDVAKQIVQLVSAGPASSIEQFAGPEVFDSQTLASTWAAVEGGRPLGTVTWQDFLAGRDVG